MVAEFTGPHANDKTELYLPFSKVVQDMTYLQLHMATGVFSVCSIRLISHEGKFINAHAKGCTWYELISSLNVRYQQLCQEFSQIEYLFSLVGSKISLFAHPTPNISKTLIITG